MNRIRNQVSLAALAVTATVMLMIPEAIVTHASEKAGYKFPCSGIAEMLNPNAFEIEVLDEKELNIYERMDAEKNRMLSELAMANVRSTLNVRTEASEESARAGYLYRDCGGTILEQVDGWTKIQSGALTGWCSNEFLLFGDDAVSLAQDVSNWMVLVKSEAVRVRKEASEEADVITVLSSSDIVDFGEIVDDNWISVEVDGELGYVNTDFIDLSFHIDNGETIEQVEARNKIEEERRKAAEKAAREAERKRNRGAVTASADEVRLLAALIYTEVGNQPYESMVGVGAVVMNRVKSPAYPNSIYSVIYASGQFTPALSGKVDRIYLQGPNATCMKAAQAAISGETTVGGATHFKLNKGNRAGIVMGPVVFY